MADEADGVDEAFEGQLRMLVTIAARVAERVARARAQALRNSAGGDEHEARQIRARIAAQRAAAQADLAKVHQSSWWDVASLPQVAEAYQVASTWAGEGEFFDTAKATIERELETRHGLGPAELPQPEQVVAAVDGPTFTMWENRPDAVQSLSKPEALALIDQMLPEQVAALDDPNSAVSNVARWAGRDDDLDRAIAAKFPAVFPNGQPPTFARSDAAGATVELTKPAALEMIDRLPAAAIERVDEQASLMSEVAEWKGSDKDVDAALAQKFPALFAEAGEGVGDAQAQRAAAERERQEASTLIAAADRVDAAEEAAAVDEHREPDRGKSAPEREAATVEWDSSERRDALAAQLDRSGVPADAAEARKSADLAQGLPARTAVTSRSKQAAAKRGQGTDPSKQRARGR